MCQLLGMNCNTPTDVTFSFRGFAQRGGNTDQHARSLDYAAYGDTYAQTEQDSHGDTPWASTA